MMTVYIIRVKKENFCQYSIDKIYKLLYIIRVRNNKLAFTKEKTMTDRQKDRLIAVSELVITAVQTVLTILALLK